MSGHRPRASGLSHDRDLRGVAAESLDVLLDPPHCNALVFEAKVQQTSLLELLGCGETKVVEAVVDRREQDGLAIVDGPLDDVCALVEYTWKGSLSDSTLADPHHWLFVRTYRSINTNRSRCANFKATAVNPQHHR